MASSDIFICYRRDDAKDYAGRIYDRLNARFPGRVFMDTQNLLTDLESIPPGSDLMQSIEEAVQSCQLFIVVMGRNWFKAVDESGNRCLYQKDDSVRRQIALALESKRKLLPVLVDRAWMPHGALFPADISALSKWGAYLITEDNFDHDMGNFTLRVKEALAGQVESPTELAAFPLDQDSTQDSYRNADVVSETELVFVCYAREDQEFTLGLAKAIKARGVQVWLDQWDIPGGADWDLAIDDALSKCCRVLVVLSPAAVKSPDVRSEYRVALDQNKPVVPVLYQKCQIPRRLALTQFIDFVSAPLSDDEKMAQLLRVLGTGM